MSGLLLAVKSTVVTIQRIENIAMKTIMAMGLLLLVGCGGGDDRPPFLQSTTSNNGGSDNVTSLIAEFDGLSGNGGNTTIDQVQNNAGKAGGVHNSNVGGSVGQPNNVAGFAGSLTQTMGGSGGNTNIGGQSAGTAGESANEGGFGGTEPQKPCDKSERLTEGLTFTFSEDNDCFEKLKPMLTLSPDAKTQGCLFTARQDFDYYDEYEINGTCKAFAIDVDCRGANIGRFSVTSYFNPRTKSYFGTMMSTGDDYCQLIMNKEYSFVAQVQ
jgi:hypothetical protein